MVGPARKGLYRLTHSETRIAVDRSRHRLNGRVAKYGAVSPNNAVAEDDTAGAEIVDFMTNLLLDDRKPGDILPRL